MLLKSMKSGSEPLTIVLLSAIYDVFLSAEPIFWNILMFNALFSSYTHT